ncbi:MAG: 3-hydroxyacyl-CoA dehydrogenase/enoyl-CoA hydratase family protein [Chitinophagales bacterium]|nr:3-hydroxyacyl-CoA dehydrogenase/enoyl-CoA hydratase family protein [Chitinophagales bacterium]
MEISTHPEQVKITPARQRKVKKAAVLGSGVMGSRIAAHFANIGLEVVLLDIVPFDISEEEKNHKAARNKLVDSSLNSAIKANPSPIYDKSFASRIKTGNFEDNMDLISECDWIIEVVIENLDIKKKVFEQVEKHRKPGTLISSNTSGIPIELMLEGRSEDFKKHFVGTHFFNPPRYLKLLEVIPSSETDSEIVDFFMSYGEKFLGKTTVLCKDTPGFIANRIGVFSIMAIFHLMAEMDLSIEEVDALTGPITGRPKSASFRTCDIVGLDTLAKVALGMKENCTGDESAETFAIPDYVNKMIENKWLGDKSKQGFYKKVKNDEGKSEILALNIKTMEYEPKSKPRFDSIGNVKGIDDLNKRLKALYSESDKGAEFLRKLSSHIFQYCSMRIPEISDELYRLDDAVRAGYGWELGPFEQWDALGIKEAVEMMKGYGFEPASWVEEMLKAGHESFYITESNVKKYYDIQKKQYVAVPGREAFIILDDLRGQKPIWKNAGTTIHDIGDGVINLEFHTKMNSMGAEVIEGINKAIDVAEKDHRGLVIGNDAPNFSAGANLAMIFMLAIEQEFDELNFAIAAFQKTMMRARYSSIPVVNGPHGLTLGGGCELSMHCDAAVCAAETYIGLVEVGVGVIPAGGGTKELVLRASDSFTKDDPMLPKLQDAFVNIATAKVATSAHEGFDIGVLDEKKDEVVINSNRVIAEAKRKVLELSEQGYSQPIERDDILVLGRTALGGLYAGAEAFYIGNYATEHDKKIANKLAFVMAGGDLSMPTKVSERYLLDLEREAFLSLLGEKKTLERIQSILNSGKPLRN